MGSRDLWVWKGAKRHKGWDGGMNEEMGESEWTFAMVHKFPFYSYDLLYKGMQDRTKSVLITHNIFQ